MLVTEDKSSFLFWFRYSYEFLDQFRMMNDKNIAENSTIKNFSCLSAYVFDFFS